MRPLSLPTSASALAGRRVERDWKSVSDADLARAAAVPDRDGKEAFVEIVRRHQTAVCAVAWSVAGRIGLTDDIAQETFFEAWKRMATLREPAKLRAWLTRIAHHTAVDALKREVSHQARQETDAAAPEVCASTRPDSAAAQAEEEALVWTSLAALPETLRTPLVLFYREGQSVAAVAAALDLSEDAVRQRLSRGRQALKSAVESRIETVLGRIQPPALLVVTIAAGIGLLSKPAAVAAGVTAGGAGAAATAGTGAGISTFMSTTSWIAAAITLAACLPLGWNARGIAVHSSSGITPPALPASGFPDDPLADYPGSKLLAVWRRLHAEHGADAAAMPVLYGRIQAEPDAFHRRALGIALMSEWSAVDPEGAFQILQLEKKNTEHAGLMMREWLKRDPDQAAAHLLANLSSALDLAAAVTKDLAELAPDYFIAVLSVLPVPPPATGAEAYVQSTAPEPLREDFAIFARHDFQAACDALPLLKGKVLAGALATVATLMAEKNPASAMVWARSLKTAEERKAAGETVIRFWAKADPAAALAGLDPAIDSQAIADLILGAAAERDLASAIRMNLENAGKFTPDSWSAFYAPLSRKFESDPLGTLHLINSQPDGVRTKLVDKLGWEDRNSEHVREAWNWVIAQKPEGMAQTLGRKFFDDSMNDDPAEACRLLKALPPEWQLDLYQNPAAFANQLTTAQLEDLLSNAPPAARGRLLEAAFDQPIRDGLPDLALWSKRLEELPPDAQGGAAGKFAKSLVYTDPQLAVRYTESIPDGVARHAAYYEMVDSWSDQDAYEASVWVDSLPQGTGRDVAIAGLLKRLTTSDPEAALVWASGIGNSEMRLRHLTQLVEEVSRESPAKIPDLLNNSALSDPDREVIGQALYKSNPAK